jgi:hypothetical protein
MGWNGESPKPLKAVRDCPDTACESYPFRQGKNPFKKSGRGVLAKREKELLEAVLFW